MYNSVCGVQLPKCSIFFSSLFSGANPNAQTIETEEMKVKVAERAQARETAKKEARQKAVEKFFEIQTAKAAEREKELERQKKGEKLPSTQAKPSPSFFSSIKSNKMNSFEQDLGHSTNPFDEDSSNPFLDDIKAASVAASVLSFGGNPFEDPPSLGESSEAVSR